MRKGFVFYALMFGMFSLVTTGALADTIFRIDPAGKETMVADGVIIWAVNGEKNNPHSVQYYFWDIRKQRLADRSTYFHIDQTGKPRVVYSEKEQREKIINAIKAKGVRAKITDVTNVVTDCLFFQVEYGSPRGYSIIGGVPQAENILLLESKGRADLEKIPFSTLKMIEFMQGDSIKAVMKNGKERQGRWQVPEVQGKKLSVILLSINNEGELIHTDLEDVVKIEFLHTPAGK